MGGFRLVIPMALAIPGAQVYQMFLQGGNIHAGKLLFLQSRQFRPHGLQALGQRLSRLSPFTPLADREILLAV